MGGGDRRRLRWQVSALGSPYAQFWLRIEPSYCAYTEMLRDVFIWAYERSADRYKAVRQSLGEPDAFRMRYRSELRDMVGSIVREGMNKKKAMTYIAEWASKNVQKPDRDKFSETAEGELLGLHEGNFARYQVRPSEFEAWQRRWNA